MTVFRKRPWKNWPSNKLKAYEQGNKSAEEQQTKAEMAEVSDEFAAQNAAEEAERVEASRSRSKIERSMQRYAENNRLLNDFYATDLVRRSAKNSARKWQN